MNRRKIIVVVGILGCLFVTPYILATILLEPYTPSVRTSEIISDYYKYSLTITDNSGRHFGGFGNETMVSITLYSLYSGEVQVLIPVSNATQVANKSLTISSNNNETIRPFIKYPHIITFHGLQQGKGIANVTLPAELNASTIFGIRQTIVLDFSDEDKQHLLSLDFHTENQSFTTIERLFLSPELEFIGIPESNPFYESLATNELGSEIRVTGETIYVDYRLRLSDSYRQQQYYRNALNNAIFIFVAQFSISLATFFLTFYRYTTKREAPTGLVNNHTPKQGQDNKMSSQSKVGKEKTYSKRIVRLVRLVEENFNIRRYELRVTLKRLIVGLIPTLVVVGFVVWLFFIVFGIATSYLAIAETRDAIIIMISIVALTIALFNYIYKLSSDMRSLFGESPQEEVINWHFKGLKESVEKEDIPLLKSLIMMKCKHPDIDLEGIYRADDSMFAQNRLLARLYE